jgi:hypothetical protein
LGEKHFLHLVTTLKIDAVSFSETLILTYKPIRCISFVGYLTKFLATDPEVLGSIPGASRFSERQWVWNGVHSATWKK